jgi:hypothetical protein
MSVRKVVDMFGGEPSESEAPTGSARTDSKSAKADKEDRLIQNYIGHLSLIINWGSHCATRGCEAA